MVAFKARAKKICIIHIYLDEATSSLDQSIEKKIMKSIQFLKRKKTLIIITHRLTTVKDCDKIFFIDKLNIFVFYI